MTVLLDTRPVADAVIAAVSAAVANTADTTQAAYDRSTMPGGNQAGGSLPALYAVVDVERRYDETAARSDGVAAATGFRITVSADGQTVAEAAWVLSRAMTAVEDVFLAVEGAEPINCRFESYRTPDMDDGRAWGSVTFTCST